MKDEAPRSGLPRIKERRSESLLTWVDGRCSWESLEQGWCETNQALICSV